MHTQNPGQPIHSKNILEEHTNVVIQKKGF